MKNNKKQIYIVTSLTSGDINFPFLDSLLRYAEFLNKDKGFNVGLKIMPTKSFTKNCGIIEELDPYLLHSDFNVNESLVLKRIIQTDFNSNPLVGSSYY